MRIRDWSQTCALPIWNHTPMLLVTPQAANRTIGQGGFPEVDQMPMFREMVCYPEEVRDPARIAEVLNRVIEKAWRGSAPAQINVPRDYCTQYGRVTCRERVRQSVLISVGAVSLYISDLFDTRLIFG